MIRLVLFVLAGGLLVYLYIYLAPRLPIINGYAAKEMCSCVFLANRNPEHVKDHELNFSFIQYSRPSVNREEKTVTSTVLGLNHKKAIYRKGLGCALVHNNASQPVKNPQLHIDNADVPPRKDMYWPAGKKVKDTLFPDVNYKALNKATNQVFDQGGQFRKKTSAVVIVYKDHLIYERYADGYDAATPIIGWSMAKSLTNAMVGIMVKHERLRIDAQNLTDTWAGDQRKNISWNDLLQMQSGLQWKEDYGSPSPATRMLFKSNNVFETVVAQPLAHKPGTKWYYSSGNSNIISGLLRKKFEHDPAYLHFPREKLFKPAGMHSAVIETDAAGNFVGSSFAYATARDWARFGMLYLHDGKAGEKQILSKEWVQYTRQPAAHSEGAYGAHFWLNRGKKYPDVPADMFSANGFKGQRVFIFPSHELVVVRMGNGKKHIDFNRFLHQVITALKA